MQERHVRWMFWTVWAVRGLLGVALAVHLPLFVDEAFYWQEGQHLAWAYAEVPGMTAWLAALGTGLGGSSLLGLRLPFLLLGSLVPLLVVALARCWLPARQAWWAGLLATVMPLSATLGLMAVPDVPLVVASLLCVLALTRLLQQVRRRDVALLAAGLVLGALSHYRFLAAMGFGVLALLSLPDGRRLLAQRGIWIALLAGLLAWLPVVAWNLANGEAGWRFQLVERHPWAFHAEGALFLLVQPFAATPLLFIALLQSGRQAMRDEAVPSAGRFVARYGMVSLAGIFVLGFFTDVERVSFHWPLSALLCLLVFVPDQMARWQRWLRHTLWALVLAGLGVGLAYAVMAGTPDWRAALAGTKAYPRNFSGWETVTPVVASTLARLPPQTQLLAGNFKTGAVLGFGLGRADIPVLPHALNDRHGRTAQLALWGLLGPGDASRPRLLVVRSEDQKFRDLLAYYHRLCDQLGPLPPPIVVPVDQGSQRFLLFELPASPVPGPCTTPAMAWVDAPLPAAVVWEPVLPVRGWAFKDGVGLDRVEVLIDGRVAAGMAYGQTYDVRPAWPGTTDPAHPDVGFTGQVDLSGLTPGTHRLGLRLHGRDGSREDWTWQTFRYRP